MKSLIFGILFFFICICLGVNIPLPHNPFPNFKMNEDGSITPHGEYVTLVKFDGKWIKK